MRPTRVLALAAMLTMAGCIAKANQDPFAYTRKPLYTGGFDLDGLQAADQQEFRVEDGSISRVHARVWVNATAGGAHVEIMDPSGRTVLSVTDDAEMAFPLALGVWTVRVTPEGEAAGHVSILVTRG